MTLDLPAHVHFSGWRPQKGKANDLAQLIHFRFRDDRAYYVNLSADPFASEEEKDKIIARGLKRLKSMVSRGK